MMKQIITILAVLLLSACGKQQKWNNLEEVSLSDLPCDTIWTIEDYRNFPSLQILNDSLLFVKNTMQQYSYQILNYQDKSAWSYCDTGDTDTIPLPRYPGLKATIDFYHYGSCSFKTLDIANGSITRTFTSLFHLKENTPSLGAMKLKENVYVGMAYNGSGLFKIYEHKDDYYWIYDYGRMPVKGGGVGEAFRAKYAGTMDGDGKYFVYGSYDFSYIALYKWSGKELQFQWERTLGKNNYEIKPNRISLKGGHTRGFEEVKLTKKHIYALNNVNSSVHSPLKNTITVLDRKGYIVARYKTHEPMYSLAVDQDEKYLFAVLLRKEGERSCIVRYNLAK
ncbi:hypothetical protein [Parabacteroides sp. AM08-6]|uniref:hypothetical protein n=1 Tax=Parabacteroides sp. AM08-6 TaxID=2292053 RepID=UPI000F009C4D|nr:hypothetical protein [Parabacteroides sp. AM08-6]RHJ75367.1 hypothetical protein DW103_17640 [Parabacteroides sp. AM08-6]